MRSIASPSPATASAPSTSASAKRSPPGLPVGLEVGDAGEVGHERRVLDHRADPAQLAAPRPHVLAEQPRLAAVGVDETDEHPQRRRLAGAVRTEQAADLTGADGEVEVVDREHGAVPLGEVADLDRRGDASSWRWTSAHPTARARALRPRTREEPVKKLVGRLPIGSVVRDETPDPKHGERFKRVDGVGHRRSDAGHPGRDRDPAARHRRRHRDADAAPQLEDRVRRDVGVPRRPGRGVRTARDSTTRSPTARRAAVREAEEECGLVLGVDDLVAVSHWTPPPVTPKRFSTWFFVARAPEGAVTIDDGEIREHMWVSPQDAIAQRDQARHRARAADLGHAAHPERGHRHRRRARPRRRARAAGVRHPDREDRRRARRALGRRPRLRDRRGRRRRPGRVTGS